MGGLTPLATAALFFEYEDVLKRSEQMMAHGLNYQEVDGFLAALASAMEPIEPRFRWRPQLQDPGDEMVLEAAVNGRADAIATHNARDFKEAASKFGVRVLLPWELLKELRS
jgi:predicted nucleic acid-binding protein